jgi:negative regulator of sigma E activity
MPADVAARIDAALTAEAASRPSAAADVSRETAPASPVQPHDVSRETAPASPVQPHDVSRETGLASPTRPHDVSRETHAPRPAPRRSRRHWPRRLLSTAATAAVLIAAGYGLHTFHTSEGSAGGDKSASVAQQPTLRERVQLLLHSTSAEDSAPSSGRAHTDASPRRSSGLPGAVSLPSCVRDALHRSDPPLAAAKEYYEGRLVYLVVLAHPGDSGKVDAFVVAASCAAASPGVRGTVLGRHTYTR